MARTPHILISTLLFPCLSLGVKFPPPLGNPFPYDAGFAMDGVAQQAESLPSHSWEYGTAAETLLELHDQRVSVFGGAEMLGADSNSTTTTLPAGLQYALEKIVIGEAPNTLSNGDGATGDPASLGVPAVLLGKLANGSNDYAKYADAAKREIEYLLGVAPRADNGAISHRADVVELWADFVYMAPPFIAYYGADTGNFTVLKEAVDQCRWYREKLQLTTGIESGLWRHIQGPQSADPGLWSTGNAWAAAGMTRILGTLLSTKHKHPEASTLAVAGVASYEAWKTVAVSELSGWIREIVDAAIRVGMDDGKGVQGDKGKGLLRNYLDVSQQDGVHGFGEISGSALIAGVVYRMAVLRPSVFGNTYVRWADKIRGTIGGGWNDTTTGEFVWRVGRGAEDKGIVRPAVNPLGWSAVDPWMAGSPEGNNFAVIMYSAWRDCVKAGQC